MTDKELLHYYNIGWHGEAVSGISFHDDLAEKAFYTGRLYYRVGDDVGSADLMTDKEIIKLIRDGV